MYVYISLFIIVVHGSLRENATNRNDTHESKFRERETQIVTAP